MSTSARNVISGNGRDGVDIVNPTGNQVQGNYVGTDVAGTAPLGNTLSGVLIEGGSANNTVGGTVAGTRNVISGNDEDGVTITGILATGNYVQGNYVGTNAAGTARLGNTLSGVHIEGGASSNTVGGTAVGAGNVIAGNGRMGIVFAGSTGNRVLGNLIGINAASNAALLNAVDGVDIGGGASGNTVGGTMAGAGNVIAGNGVFGVEITDDGTTGNKVQGNSILGNLSHGVFITAGAVNNLIGGTTAGAGNRIANNGGNGVLIGSDPSVNLIYPAGDGNTVEGNSIFANAVIGIDLGPNDGPTPNDPNDTDTGPNNSLNTPVLTSAFLSGTSLFLSGFINTQTNKDLRIEFFANSDSAGQGQTFLGFVNVSTGPNNTVAFAATFTVPATILAGQTITATATDELGNTSEFSLPLTIE